jgi:outer membrane protein
MVYQTFNSMRIKFLATAVLFTLFAFTAQAQKIGYVDINLILESIEEYQKAQSELDRISAQWRQEIAQEYDNIKSMYNRYQAEQVLLSDEARRGKEDEIMEKEKQVRELQKQRFGPEGELFLKRKELVEPIQERVFEVIEEYANDRSYDFIFEKGSAAGMIYADQRFDVTKDVLDRLKRK